MTKPIVTQAAKPKAEEIKDEPVFKADDPPTGNLVLSFKGIKVYPTT